MGKYSDSPIWEDVIPIAHDDGGPNALAVIAYTEEYTEAMSYLRAVTAQDEKSDRVLNLTEDIIKMNPAHYTVWLYRVDNLFALEKDLKKELEWLNSIALKNLKNYQIWHHRQTIMGQIKTLPDSEIIFLEQMFHKDAKNYHVWSYRQWLVRHFSLWDSELPFVEKLLEEDVRNNSAWNHRWFIVFGRNIDPTTQSLQDTAVFSKVPALIFEREIEFTKANILLAPQNQSPWTYLKAVTKQQGDHLTQLQQFAESFASIDDRPVTSTHALEILADAYAERDDSKNASKALDLLADKYDPIRKNFWQFKKAQLAAV